MSRILGLLVTLVLAAGVVAVPPASAAPDRAHHAAHRVVADRSGAPSRDRWLADVKAAMRGSGADLRARLADARPGERLAVNFDIDNTVLATYYDGGGAIPRMLRFARFLARHDVAVLFNTGRVSSMRATTEAQLTRNGFPVDGLCLRGQGRSLVFGKQRCRDLFAARGWTLVANVGNNKTDFAGDGYERAYRLPNYGVLG